MAAKYDIKLDFKNEDSFTLEKAAKILNEILRSEKFTLERYIHNREEKLEIEPSTFILDESYLSFLEIAAKALSSIGIIGYIDIFLFPYKMEYIYLDGNGNYFFGEYIRKTIQTPNLKS